MAFKFSSNIAFRMAEPLSFHKGEEYFEDGLVNKVSKVGNVYKAVVQGSRRYDVSILVAAEDEIKASCNCPYDGGGICKHAVAVILALAQNPEFAAVNLPAKDAQKEQTAEKLIKQASETQVRKFLERLLKTDNQTVHDFNIFLQGSKETSATVQSYKSQISRKLDELDLGKLEEAWYSSGDDFYDYHPECRNEDGYDEETLSSVAKPFIEEAQKYAGNKNYGESAKIFQAVIEAFLDKEREVDKGNGDVADWFFDEANAALNSYYPVLSEIDDPGIKKAGLEYLCRLFENNQFAYENHWGEMEKGLKAAVKNKIEAEICLRALADTIAKREPSTTESSLLAHLYLLAGNEIEFEKVSVDNLKNNLGLALDLLKFYKQRKRKSDILATASQVLGRFIKKAEFSDWNYRGTGIEIDIREFLKGVFDSKTDYYQIIDNLEKLFLESKKLNDYKELVRTYKTKDEKEEFLKKMKPIFTHDREVEIMFKVFESEGQKEEILELTAKYENEACFPDMIAVISKTYPRESFANYKKKIEHLLKEANVKAYPTAVYHFKQMKRIGATHDFDNFVSWMASNYSRRRNLMEEMKKGGLI
jgi:hypothetical protein